MNEFDGAFAVLANGEDFFADDGPGAPTGKKRNGEAGMKKFVQTKSRKSKKLRPAIVKPLQVPNERAETAPRKKSETQQPMTAVRRERCHSF